MKIINFYSFISYLSDIFNYLKHYTFLKKQKQLKKLFTGDRL